MTDGVAEVDGREYEVDVMSCAPVLSQTQTPHQNQG